MGVTAHLDNRLKEHKSGKGAKFTKENYPKEIIYKEEYLTLSQARKREYQLKGWTRSKKEALIQGDKKMLVRLSKKRMPVGDGK